VIGLAPAPPVFVIVTSPTSLAMPKSTSQAGLSPAVWARHLREAPLPGLYPKSVIYQFATGDQVAVNPGTTAVLRAGNLADRTLYYRYDLAFAQDPSMPGRRWLTNESTAVRVDFARRAGSNRHLSRLRRDSRDSSGAAVLLRGSNHEPASGDPELHPR
jgi:hypothetical protein